MPTVDVNNRDVSSHEQYHVINTVCPNVRHYCVQVWNLKMVQCAIFGCNNHSDCDNDVSYYKIPSMITHTHDERDWELSTERRDGFLAAIAREDLTVELLERDTMTDYRVCSRHFLSGKPAKLYNVTSPDWLPSVNLGHSKKQQLSQQLADNNARHKCSKRRAAKQRAREEDDKIFKEQMESVCSLEIGGIVSGLVQEIAQETIDVELACVNFMHFFIAESVDEEFLWKLLS